MSTEPIESPPSAGPEVNTQSTKPDVKQERAETVEESTTKPIEAPQSTIPEVVQTVDDIYDFDGLSGNNMELDLYSDIEKEMSDMEMDNVSMGDIDDIEKEILDEL